MACIFRYVVGACGAALLSIASAHATTFTTLYSIKASGDGASPQAALINVGGTYFGTTTSGGTPGFGTVFSINPATGAETVLYNFEGGNDGAAPYAALLSVGGTLYGTTTGGGTHNHGTVFSINLATGAETVLYSFAGGSDGAFPQAALINVGGTLYGTTYQGGAGGGSGGDGTLFSINPATGAETVVHTFVGGSDGSLPDAALINVGGILYGTTGTGGTGNGVGGGGTLFSFNPATGAETVLHSFAVGTDGDGQYPTGALINVGGTLYGTTVNGGSAFGGTVFSFTPATGTETVLHSFVGGSDGASPEAGLINVGDTVYGTTTYGGPGNCSFQQINGCGTVFAVNAVSGAETVLYSFAGGNDGANPQAGLISAGNTLYGTTSGGGTHGQGMVFSVNSATGAETVLYSFTGAISVFNRGNAVQNVNGTLFLSASVGGSANIGDIVEIDPSNDAAMEIYAFTNETEGAYPVAALINAGSTLYGTTESGGNGSCSGGCGTVFSINPATGAETLLYSFAGGHDGILPAAALLNVGGTLYGTTSGGGKHSNGTVYTIDPATGAETVVYSFAGGVDGAGPTAELINVGAMLYGTTDYGGTGKCDHRKGCGTVFSINPATGAETVLYRFPGHGGKNPAAALTNVGGTLYGTASEGGGLHRGIVFSINPATGAEKTLHKFGAGTDGADPQAALINVGGTLYGTTSEGGTSGQGTVFSINPTTGAEHVVYSFTGGSDGGAPAAALVSVGSTLYGTTNSGGAARRGTVFSLAP